MCARNALTPDPASPRTAPANPRRRAAGPEQHRGPRSGRRRRWHSPCPGAAARPAVHRRHRCRGRRRQASGGTEPAFVVRGRVLLLRMRPDQGRVEIHDHSLGLNLLGERRAMRPDPRTGLRPRGADRRDRLTRLLCQGIEEPTHCRVRGHRTEQLRLGTDHGDVGQTVTTQTDRNRQIEHRLARVMDRPGRPWARR